MIMQIALIENSDKPEIAEFIYDDEGNRLLFDSSEDAEKWCMENAEPGVFYKQYSDD